VRFSLKRFLQAVHKADIMGHMRTLELLQITPQEVMRNNAERSLTRERERVRLAVEGLKRVIGVAVNHSKEWNPDLDRIATAIIIEAENSLREIDGCKQTKSPTRHWLQSAKSMWQLQVLAVRLQVRKLWNLLNAPIQSPKAFRFGKRVIHQ